MWVKTSNNNVALSISPSRADQYPPVYACSLHAQHYISENERLLLWLLKTWLGFSGSQRRAAENAVVYSYGEILLASQNNVWFSDNKLMRFNWYLLKRRFLVCFTEGSKTVLEQMTEKNAMPCTGAVCQLGRTD